MKTKWLAISLLLCLLCGVACADGTTDLIIGSRTTQSFTDEAVSDEDLLTILEAGLSATSAINSQPWYLVAITNQDVMDEITGSGGSFGGGAPAGMPAPGGDEGFGESSGAPSGMPAPGSDDGFGASSGAPSGAPAGGAGFGGGAKASLGSSPVAIVIYMNEKTSSPNASFDCGLACQNMFIAAKALGYGAKIVSSPTMQLNSQNHDALCEKLGVDPSYTAVAVLLIGRESEAVDGTSGSSVRNGVEEKVSIIK